MKKSNHIAPTTVLLFLFSAIGVLGVSLANLIGMGTEGNKTVSAIVFIVSVLFSIGSIVFSIWFIRNRKLQNGDEFTTKVVYESGFVAFYLIFILTLLFFVAMHLVVTFQKGADTVKNFAEVIGTNVVVIGIVLIQVVCASLFAITVFSRLKKGEAQNMGDADEA